MTSLQLAPRNLQRPPIMANDNDDVELKLLGRALANLRDRRGMTQADAGAALATDEDPEGMSSQGWGKYEAGQRNGLFKPATQRRLTAAIRSTPEELMREFRKLASEEALIPPDEWERDAAEEAPMLPVLEPIRAGNWLEMDGLVQVAAAKRFPVARDPRYRHAEQWLRPVSGDSMNKRGILEGDMVHVVSIAGSGHTPETGEIVEVQRIRFEGAEREITLKEIEVTPRGVVLWPRSTNERYQKPIDLRDGVKRDEHISVDVTGFVVASIRRF